MRYIYIFNTISNIIQGEQKMLARAPVKAKPPSTGSESFSSSPRKIHLRNVNET